MSTTTPAAPTSAWESVDAVTAAKYLLRNHTPEQGVVGTNRNSSSATVSNYAAAMIRGEWHLTHQGIAFATNGDLIDGQERLQAIIKAAETVPSIQVRLLVTRGLPKESMLVMDLGRRRSPADFLAMHGEINTIQLAAVTRLVYSYYHIPLPDIGTIAPWSGRAAGVTPQQIRATLEEHPGIRDVIVKCMGVTPKINRTAVCSLAYLATQERPSADSDEFIEKIKKGGAGTDEGHPVYEFLAHIRRKTDYGKKVNTLYTFAVIIKAFNAFADGEMIKSMRWTMSTERFPRIIKK